ncbi:MAG TPA: DUF4421 domain-containing protein [Flavobacteriales bacterium]|nr:DUF4421 domain-containing protein [Flavobacteriales bacterium]
MLLLVLGSAYGSKAQQDTNYVKDYSRRITYRTYLSHKFNSLQVHSSAPGEDLRYRPNGRVNFGVGASLRKFTLNIGVPIPFLNDDNDRKGRTRYLDAQANIYGTKQASNLFLQVFKGYHITSHSKAMLGWDGSTAFPYRRDLLQYNIGLSSLRILNHSRFSYRAGFNQDAIQLRSQGTWLIGGYLTAYVVRADSSLIPGRLRDQFPATADVRSASYFDLGPMVGYAYTHVMGRKWFATVSGAVGAGGSVQVARHEGPIDAHTESHAGVGWHSQFRVALGYNTSRRYIGALFSQEHIGYLQRAGERFTWDVGVVRVVFALRFRERPASVERGTRWLQRKKNEVLPAP